MNDIVPFSFESQSVRIIDREGQPWFALADVCAVLGISNVSDAAGRLDDDERDDIALTDTIGRSQSAIVINESGLYKLVLRSRKESAKRFTKWLTSIVLPSIRRTGAYGAPAPALDLHDPAVLQRLVHDLSGMAMDADQRIAQLEPKADALDRIADAQGLMCLTDAAKALGVPPRKLSAWMEGAGWIFRRSDGGPYVAHGKALAAHLLEHKGYTVQRPGKPDKWVAQVMVTPKGLARLGELRAGMKG